MKLIFATNNQHKVEEIQLAVGNSFELITLKNAGIEIDIPEPHDSLNENASEKSRTIYTLTGINCFGEDSGLEVAALNGAPGVKSARYAGDERQPAKNIEKLLQELGDNPFRKATFRTVISLIIEGREYFFEGSCEGNITKKPAGTQGFGYDPIFVPIGSSKTFAEMTALEKSLYSHRKKATDQLISFLKSGEGRFTKLTS